MRLKLRQLGRCTQIEGMKYIDGEMEITGVSDSSLSVKEGHIFVAINGFAVDGHQYIYHAIENGAQLIIGEQDISDLPVPYIKVESSRKTIGQLSAALFNYPSQNKLVIGVTGTNGKTTTSFFLTHLLKKLGYSVSFFGTVYNEINGERMPSQLTTPSASFIHESLAKSKDEAVVIEVSSQGLDQMRMEGMSFDYTLFMNLQKDHLDYHKTIEDYFMAKKRLFGYLKPHGKAVVNTDDDWGNKLFHLLKAEGKNVLTLGQSEENTIKLETVDELGCKGTLDQQRFMIQPPIPGKYNSYNLLMASLVIKDLGHTMEDIQESIRDTEGIPGRFEQYTINHLVEVVIDYAHTTEALDALLKTLQKLYSNYSLTHIFGFRGGGRDIAKRKEMVKVSTAYSNHTILTLDDLNDISYENMKKDYLSYENEQITVEMDRTLAIKQAIDSATEPTIIVLTGKGHENYQEQMTYDTLSDKDTALYMSELYKVREQ